MAQVALSVVLLSAAGLFVHHLSNLRNQDFGFQRTSLLLVTLDPAKSGYPREQLFAPYQHLLGRLAEIPGVRSVTLSGVTPISGAGASRFIKVEGFEEAAEARRYVPLNWVGPRYFETFGTPLLAGRDFAFTDRGGPPVAIVNQAMARYYFGDRNPIGGRFQLVGPSNSGITGAPPDQVYEIVGVVGDAKYLDLREVPPRTIYLNAFQEPRMFANRFALRTTGRPAAVAGEVRRIVREELKTVPVAEYDDDGRSGRRVHRAGTGHRDALQFLRRPRRLARRARPLRPAGLHRDAPHQRDRDPHRARRDASPISRAWCSGAPSAWFAPAW